MATPYVLLAEGQSNMFLERTYSWTPSARLKVWNNQLGLDNNFGTAWVTPDPTKVSAALLYANGVANTRPGLDVYVIILANGSLDVSHFTPGNDYNWETATTAPPSAGAIRGNGPQASLTELYVSKTDATGANKTAYVQRIYNGNTVKIFNKTTGAMNAWAVNAAPVDMGAYYKYPIGARNLSWVLAAGAVHATASPDFYRAAKTIVPAALAAIPGSKVTIDLHLWWLGESDAQHTGETRFKAQWREMVAACKAESWYPTNTKMLVFGISKDEIGGTVYRNQMNTWLSALVSEESANRIFIPTHDRTTSAHWQDAGKVHMTAEGYIAAAMTGVRMYLPGAFPPDIGSVATASGWTTIMDVSADARHVTSPSGKSIGLWFDACPAPFKNNAGAHLVICGAQSGYRFAITGNDWTGASGYTSTPYAPCLVSNNTGVERAYDHRIWIFGTYRPNDSNTTVYAIGHHEWYNQRQTVDGYPGFNLLDRREWVTSPIWLKSTNNGQTWSPKTGISGADNSHRLFLKPEAWGIEQHETLYGFQHPSNIVRPTDVGFADEYYYACLDSNQLGALDEFLTSGFALIRWSDMENPATTEFWDGQQWVGRTFYEGNEGQKPYIFFAQSNHDPYTMSQRNDRMAQSIRFHEPSGNWMIFGATGMEASYFCYAVSPTLEKPEFEARGRRMVALTGGGTGSDYVSNRYFTVFDPTLSGNDRNFTKIGNTPLVLRTFEYTKLQVQSLQITV